MREVYVKLWCDKTWADSHERVESDSAHFLELDGKRVRLDLTDGNYRDLYAVIKPWLEAGHPEDEKPKVGHSFAAGTKEAKDWYRDLRLWADSVGRSEEYRYYHRNGELAKDFSYPKKLRDDYEAYLLSQAQAA